MQEKKKSKTVIIWPVFYFLNPELRALVTKNKITLERYKGLVQSNYKESANGDYTKEVLAKLQAEEQ